MTAAAKSAASPAMMKPEKVSCAASMTRMHPKVEIGFGGSVLQILRTAAPT